MRSRFALVATGAVLAFVTAALLWPAVRAGERMAMVADAAPANADGPLQVERAVRDLGVVAPGGSLRFTERFAITNVSDGPVRLDQRVRTTCGCSSAELSTTRLAPGESATLTANLDWATAFGSQDVGLVVTVIEPVRQVLSMRVLARIDRGARLSPQWLSFNNVGAGEIPSPRLVRVFVDRTDESVGEVTIESVPPLLVTKLNVAKDAFARAHMNEAHTFQVLVDVEQALQLGTCELALPVHGVSVPQTLFVSVNVHSPERAKAR